MNRTKLIRIGMLLLVVMLAMSLVACGAQDQEAAVSDSGSQETTSDSQAPASDDQEAAADSEAPADAKTIALIPPAMTSPYYASVIKAATPKAEELGYTLVTLAPDKETDFDQQVQIVEDMITNGVDGIALSAINADAVVSAVKKANEAGIPVVVFNSLVDLPGGDIYCYVGYDQRGGAAQVADYLNEIKDGQAKVAILEGTPSSFTTERKGGFEDQIAQYPGIEVVASQAADWEREKGMNVTTNMLQANPDIDTIFALSDEMALGAAQAVKAMGKEGMTILSMDGNPNAIAAVADGLITATFWNQPVGTGEIAIEQLDQAIQGVPAAEKYQIVTGVLVDLSNCADYPQE